MFYAIEKHVAPTKKKKPVGVPGFFQAVCNPTVVWASAHKATDNSVIEAVITSAFCASTGATVAISHEGYVRAIYLYNRTRGRYPHIAPVKHFAALPSRSRMPLRVIVARNAKNVSARGTPQQWQCIACTNRFGSAGQHAYGTERLCAACYKERATRTVGGLLTLTRITAAHVGNRMFVAMIAAVAKTTRSQIVALLAKNGDAVRAALQPLGNCSQNRQLTFDYWDAVFDGQPARALVFKMLCSHCTKNRVGNVLAHTSALTSSGRAQFGVRRRSGYAIAKTPSAAIAADLPYFCHSHNDAIYVVATAMLRVGRALFAGDLRVTVRHVPAFVKTTAVTTTAATDTPSRDAVADGYVAIGAAHRVTWEHIAAYYLLGAKRVTLVGSHTQAVSLASAAVHNTSWGCGAVFCELTHDTALRRHSIRGTPMVVVDTSLTQCELYSGRDFVAVQRDSGRDLGRWNRPLLDATHIFRL